MRFFSEAKIPRIRDLHKSALKGRSRSDICYIYKMKYRQKTTNNNDNDRYNERLGQRRRGEGALEEIAKEGLFEQNISKSSLLSYSIFILQFVI